jgi:holo-[acyl-carrier protein] synthase
VRPHSRHGVTTAEVELMTLGVGIDLCDVARMERELAREDGGFRDEVFSAAEIAYCEAMHRPALHYAARFAAKEAVFKALTAAGVPGATWRDVEIARGPAGEPRVVLHGAVGRAAQERGVGAVAVSLSHTRELAAACAAAESGEGSG